MTPRSLPYPHSAMIKDWAGGGDKEGGGGLSRDKGSMMLNFCKEGESVFFLLDVLFPSLRMWDQWECYVVNLKPSSSSLSTSLGPSDKQGARVTRVHKRASSR